MNRSSASSEARARYLVVALELSEAIEDEVASQLFELGCLGVQPRGGMLCEADGELDEETSAAETHAGGAHAETAVPTEAAAVVEVEVVFPCPAGTGGRAGTPPADLADDVERVLRRWRNAGYRAEMLEWRPLEDRDWLAEVRARAQPITIGRFIFDPRDPDDPDDLDAPKRELPGAGATPAVLGGVDTRAVGASAPTTRTFVLPATRAFGTGSHETTRLMIQLLQTLQLDERAVLDVGSGSGILGLVAHACGARRVVGVEVDLVSNFVARSNARRNDTPLALVAGTVECLQGPEGPEGPAPRSDGSVALQAAGLEGCFDVVLVNVLPHRIAGQEEAIRNQLTRSGQLVLSGLLVAQHDEVLAVWADLGLRAEEVQRQGDWLAAVLRGEAPVGEEGTR